MTDRKAQKRRLERAGYVHLSGWVPAEYAATVAEAVDKHRAAVARVLAGDSGADWPACLPLKARRALRDWHYDLDPTRDQVSALSDWTLRRIPGIGDKLLAEIRKHAPENNCLQAVSQAR